eukprot:Hpha_TRINITY_DN3214_c0_g1::TRINITY_DN3214_c0_g1_i1::g.185769::m.185769
MLCGLDNSAYMRTVPGSPRFGWDRVHCLRCLWHPRRGARLSTRPGAGAGGGLGGVAPQGGGTDGGAWLVALCSALEHGALRRAAAGQYAPARTRRVLGRHRGSRAALADDSGRGGGHHCHCRRLHRCGPRPGARAAAALGIGGGGAATVRVRRGRGGGRGGGGPWAGAARGGAACVGMAGHNVPVLLPVGLDRAGGYSGGYQSGFVLRGTCGVVATGCDSLSAHTAVEQAFRAVQCVRNVALSGRPLPRRPAVGVRPGQRVALPCDLRPDGVDLRRSPVQRSAAGAPCLLRRRRRGLGAPQPRHTACHRTCRRAGCGIGCSAGWLRNIARSDRGGAWCGGDARNGGGVQSFCRPTNCRDSFPRQNSAELTADVFYGVHTFLRAGARGRTEAVYGRSGPRGGRALCPYSSLWRAGFPTSHPPRSLIFVRPNQLVVT